MCQVIIINIIFSHFQDKSTGDLKHAAENREGETYSGFYSFLDANGKHHTVHYSDDGKGFKATVG